MKATTLLSTIITSLFLTVNLQAQEKDLILTEDQNSEWIDDLKSADLEESLDLVKQRIMADTDVFYISTRNAHGKDRVEQGFREKSYCRPVYSFTSEGKKPVILEPNPDEARVEKLQNFLESENISEIEVETGTRAMAIYGSRASCGVISLQLRDEKSFNQLQDILK